MERSHTGLCKCRKCGAVNPWRSDFQYGKGDNVSPGFLGKCRKCDHREPQDVLLATEALWSDKEILENY